MSTPPLADLRLRDATQADLPALVAIFNESIPGRAANAELRPVSVASRQAWFEAHRPDRHPLWVAERAGRIVGWVGIAPLYQRPAYHITAELSLYLTADYQGRGLGTWLAREMIAACPRLGIENLVSLVFAHNPASIALHQRLGFSQWGYLPAVTELDGQRRDVVMLGLAVAVGQGSDPGR